MQRNARTLGVGAALLTLAAAGVVLLHHHGHAMLCRPLVLGALRMRTEIIPACAGGWSVTVRDVVAIVSWAFAIVGVIVTAAGLIDRLRLPQRG
jgi:hypothetical protein